MAVRSRELHSSIRSSTRSVTSLFMGSRRSLQRIVSIITIVLALLALYAVMGHIVTWSRTRIDDLRYGTPRTMQVDAIVGHNDGAGIPSHFIAMNLNRQVLILELPGGDATKIRSLTGPYLFGDGEDATPVLLSFDDMNKDGSRDLIVTIKNEAIIYVNRDGTFQPLSPEERSQIQQAP